MQYKIVNKLRQLQNVLVRDASGSSKTLALMPKGKPNSEKILSEQELTEDAHSKKAMGYLDIQTIGN